MTFEEWKKTQFLSDAWSKPKTERHKATWQASRDNMQEYQKYEFCRAVECENLQEKCVVGDGYCSFTAKELHHWLKDNGYRIVKGE